MARGNTSVGITLGILSSAAVSILVLGIVFMLAPTIGGRMEEAMPTLSETSEWNASYNTDLVTGADVWEQLSPFLIVVGLVMLAAIIIFVLRGVGG